MITQLLTLVTSFIITIIGSLGYAGVALLMAVESAAVPLPSEVIMPFAGYLAGEGRFTLWGLALAGGFGSMIGSWITYLIGRRGGRPLIEKYGTYVLISKHDLELADRFFVRYGLLSTFIGRLLPVVRTFISIPAGIARVPLWKFLGLSFVGSVVWSYVLAWFGYKLGPAWITLRERAHWLDVVIVVLIVVGAVWWVYRHVRTAKP